MTTAAILRKTHIVKDWNGHELERSTVVALAGNLAAEYERTAARLRARHPRAYHFCDASEGTPIEPIAIARRFKRIA